MAQSLRLHLCNSIFLILLLAPLPCAAGTVRPAVPKNSPAPSSQPSKWQSLKSAGDLAIVSGDATLAEGKYRAALAAAENAKDNKAIIVCLSALADCLTPQHGKIAEEENLRTRALELAEKTFGSSSPQIAVKQAQLSDLAARKGELGVAEERAELAMALLNHSEDKFPLEMAVCYQAVAERQILAGTPGLADGSFKKAFELRSANLPANDLALLNTCRRYSELLKQLGRKDEARKLEERIILAKAEAPAMDTGAPVKAEKNEDKALNKSGDKILFLKLLNEAKEADKAEDHDKSVSCWKLAVQEAEKSGAKDGRLPYALIHLGDAYQANKQKDEAGALYKRALDLREQTGATNSLAMARNCSRIAAIELQRKNASEADRLFSKALALEDQLNAPDLLIAVTLQNLLATGLSTKDNAKIEQIAKRLIPLSDKMAGDFGAMEKRTATAILAMIYIKSGRQNEALALSKSLSSIPQLDRSTYAKTAKDTYAADEAVFDKSEEAGFLSQ